MTMRIRLEIVPFGMEKMAYTIHKIDVNNTLEMVDDRFLYQVIHQNVTRNEGGELMWTVGHRRQDGPLVLAVVALNKLLEAEGRFYGG